MTQEQIIFSEGDAVTSSANSSWRDVLAAERQQEYFKKALDFVEQERRMGKVVFPPNSDVFNALNFTPLDQVKVVILGQDPYYCAGQAHGLCFSVQPGVAFPPSLQNIFKEISSDVGSPPPKDGCLERWARQGVLLLNAVLTVESGKPQSHANIGWEQFTDQVVRALNQHTKGLIFLLWGSPAQKKGSIIDTTRHHVLKCPHPSPLSAHRGFTGCQHFSKTNAILKRQGVSPIEW